MTILQHSKLLGYSFVTWLSFYLIGLPDYYQQWPFWIKLPLLPLVTLLYIPITKITLKKYWSDGQHVINSCWLAFYLTLPLFIYDYLLLGVYKDLGINFVFSYWYLSFFYFSFWLQFPYIAWRMEKAEGRR